MSKGYTSCIGKGIVLRGDNNPGPAWNKGGGGLESSPGRRGQRHERGTAPLFVFGGASLWGATREDKGVGVLRERPPVRPTLRWGLAQGHQRGGGKGAAGVSRSARGRLSSRGRSAGWTSPGVRRRLPPEQMWGAGARKRRGWPPAGLAGWAVAQRQLWARGPC